MSQQSAAINTFHSAVLALFNCKSSKRKQEENGAEAYFLEITKRNSAGRCIVSFPLKKDPDFFGESFSMIKQHFFNIEKKLAKDPKLAID